MHQPIAASNALHFRLISAKQPIENHRDAAVIAIEIQRIGGVMHPVV